ncbi:MAG: DUF427 domain-containing protein [Bacteroidota bacterium]
MFEYDGTERPDFAIEPKDGQESVWDYPRPPRLEADHREVTVKVEGSQLAHTSRAMRVLETASPPTFYIPPEAVYTELFIKSDHTTHCEWKGRATYWNLHTDNIVIPNAAWSYEDPKGTFAPIAGYFSFYPSKVMCWINDEPVKPQPGSFYGGWMTSEIVGPVKGEDDTQTW